MRPLRKCREASLAGADGHERSECEPDRAKQGRIVCSATDYRKLNEPFLDGCALSGLRGLRPPPSAPAKERGHLN
jgi:hypothetical protein